MKMIIGLCLCLLAWPSFGYSHDFNSPTNLTSFPIVFFGDSLSDAGNKHQITQSLNASTEEHVGVRALPPYYEGRFSNGPTWADYLNQRLLKRFSEPARAAYEGTLTLSLNAEGQDFAATYAERQGNNWAVGGAMAAPGYFFDFDVIAPWTYQSGGELMPNVHRQIQDYLHRYSAFSEEQWIVIQGGANNLWFSTFGDRQDHPKCTAHQLLKSLTLSVEKGAKKVLVMNLPPLANSPAFASHREQASAFIETFNAILKVGLEALKKQYPGVDIRLLDADQLFKNIEFNINQQGYYQNSMLNVYIDKLDQSAWDFTTGQIAEDTNTYVYWDGLHPTTAVHKLLAAKAEQIIHSAKQQ